MKSFALIICQLLLAVSIFSQTLDKTISGLVKDIQNAPAGAATIRLQNAADSTMVQTVSAAADGKFSFPGLKTGSYLLSVSYAGCKPYFSSTLHLDDKHPFITLPVIILLPDKQGDLKEVVVTSRKPLIEQDIDKTIVNVEAMISSTTGNALEVLGKTPGIMVDPGGDISLNGKPGALVLIDGRPTYMSANDLAAYLRSIPGSTLDKIELMSNPPAKYDAAGSAVINIRLKRNKTKGTTGSLSLSFSQGRRNSSYNTLSLNHLGKKINLFGNISANRDHNFDDDQFSRTFYNENGERVSSVNLNSYYRYQVHDLSGRIGMDYMASSKTTIGFIASSYASNKTDEADSYNRSHRFNSINKDSSGYGNTKRTSQWRQATANINLQHQFNKKGHELTADINYINYNNKANRLLNNLLYSAEGAVDSSYLFQYHLPAAIDIYTFKADYTRPLPNKLVLSAGIKSSVVENNTESVYSDIIGGLYKFDPSKSNHFIYTENINALYVNARKNWNRLGMQAGLRIENTNTKGNQLGNEVVPASINKRNYSGLFPSLFISYQLDSNSKHQLSFNYSRRISRPGYAQLNPFLVFIDQYTYSTGNPLLDAAYQNNTELTYRYKQRVSISWQYNRINNTFFNATRPVNNVFISRPENTDTRYMMALMLNINIAAAKWWRLNMDLGGANFVTKGTVYNQNLNESIYAWRANILSQFSFPDNWSAELSSRYTSRIIQLQQVIEPRYQLNAGIQKKIWQGKASLKLTVNDIFYTLRQNDRTTGLLNTDAYHINKQDSRRIGIGINFNFGNQSFARKRKYSDNSSDDVKERVD